MEKKHERQEMGQWSKGLRCCQDIQTFRGCPCVLCTTTIARSQTQPPPKSAVFIVLVQLQKRNPLIPVVCLLARLELLQPGHRHDRS